MAVLDEAARQFVWRKFMAAGNTPGTILKADLRAAVNAADDWVDANAAAFNTALPVAFRTAATAQQKAILLGYLAFKWAGLL